MRPPRFLVSLFPISLLAITLSGCTLVETPAASSGGEIHGTVYGGQQPVVGATVNLYAAGTGGYGTSSALISTTPAITDSHGSFVVTGDYSCTTGQQVYVLVTGGNAGAGTNSALSLMAILGNCPSPGGTSAFLSSLPTISVNEVTTVAAAYVMAPYASDAFTVGTSGTSLAKVGVANAFANAANLVNVVTGVANTTTPAGNGTVPQSEIDTLANILAACVNTGGPTHTFPGGNACDTLLNTATSNGIPSNVSGGAAASSDTATAAIYIAQHPAVNISTLYGLQAGVGSPFAPYLSSAPNDFTVALNIRGGGMDYPNALAVDSSGNVWASNYMSNSLSEFSPSGAAITSAFGYYGGGVNQPVSIAIDASGNVWAVNRSSHSVPNNISKFNSSGTAISGSNGYTDSSLANPEAIAIDPSGNIWVTNGSTSSSLTELNSSGTVIAVSSGYNNSDGRSMAIDPSGNIWAVNQRNLDKVQDSGGIFTSSTTANVSFGGSGGSLPDIAIGASGNVWALSEWSMTLSEFDSWSEINSSGTIGLSGACGGQQYSSKIAIDGAGNIWITNTHSGFAGLQAGLSISECSSSDWSITGSNGYGGGGLTSPTAIAVDGSGNVWVANTNNSNLTEFVGAGIPVVTPIVANLLPPYASNNSGANKP